MFWTSVLDDRQAVALAHADGLSARDVLPHATEPLTGPPDFLPVYASAHGGDAERLSMGTASVEHALRTHADAGVDTTLPAAAAAVFRRGMDAGHGAASVSSLVHLMKTAHA